METDMEIRQWAIERAIECSREHYTGPVTTMAGAFFDFVMGTNDAEVLRAARQLADKVKD